ncbi:hypothetical protein DL89DRAFT_72200 [Linderina pennispora]|uniref:Uncharacterized protein n=1 Tax=Linderina pennispora TaxID=61395 RepID=A0A1Y1VXW7_9FUNG|nr:uncharacterized protein DL89DRAFT_72200 [Linderina pennispora]ORX66130.1 hypothetical protein DL89DRAFT_72200 [Linderina pennispora]
MRCWQRHRPASGPGQLSGQSYCPRAAPAARHRRPSAHRRAHTTATHCHYMIMAPRRSQYCGPAPPPSHTRPRHTAHPTAWPTTTLSRVRQVRRIQQRCRRAKTPRTAHRLGCACSTSRSGRICGVCSTGHSFTAISRARHCAMHPPLALVGKHNHVQFPTTAMPQRLLDLLPPAGTSAMMGCRLPGW